MAIRKATGIWEGNLKQGKGTVRTESGALDAKYSFASRFEDGTGSNPDELVGAALASCFSMFLANVLAEAGHTAERVSTTANVHFGMKDGAPEISKIALVTEAKVPGIDRSAFEEHAQKAKKGCPVSKALKGVEITLDANLKAA